MSIEPRKMTDEQRVMLWHYANTYSVEDVTGESWHIVIAHILALEDELAELRLANADLEARMAKLKADLLRRTNELRDVTVERERQDEELVELRTHYAPHDDLAALRKKALAMKVQANKLGVIKPFEQPIPQRNEALVLLSLLAIQTPELADAVAAMCDELAELRPKAEAVDRLLGE